MASLKRNHAPSQSFFHWIVTGLDTAISWVELAGRVSRLAPRTQTNQLQRLIFVRYSLDTPQRTMVSLEWIPDLIYLPWQNISSTVRYGKFCLVSSSKLATDAPSTETNRIDDFIFIECSLHTLQWRVVCLKWIPSSIYWPWRNTSCKDRIHQFC